MPESAITSATHTSCFKVQLEAQGSHPTWLAQCIDKDNNSYWQIFSKPNIACDLLLRSVPAKTLLICNNLEKSQLLHCSMAQILQGLPCIRCFVSFCSPDLAPGSPLAFCKAWGPWRGSWLPLPRCAVGQCQGMALWPIKSFWKCSYI